MTSSYVYMAGSPTELYFPINLDGEEELKELLPLISRKGKRILTPFFIGVYQVDKSDKSSRTIVSHNVSATMESFNFAREHIGLTERLNPLLIHVIFSPPWNVDLVRVCFRDSDVFQRLAFSPSDNLPDFSKKDTSLAEAISKSHELSPQYSSLFREINNGVWNGSKKADIERLSLADQINVKPENGESLQDLADRTIRGLDLLKSCGGERNILISHGCLKFKHAS